VAVNAELKSGHSPLYALLADASGIVDDAISLHQWVEAHRAGAQANDNPVIGEAYDFQEFS
jgi:hypothetical protein